MANGTELSRSAERGSEATERSAVGWSEMLGGTFGHKYTTLLKEPFGTTQLQIVIAPSFCNTLFYFE
jgi:hypothetical protein